MAGIFFYRIIGYISYISGTTLEKLTEKKNNLVTIKTIFFTLGFSFVFIAFGLTASVLGKFFLYNSNILRIIAGVIIIFFSLQLIGIINLIAFLLIGYFFQKK